MDTITRGGQNLQGRRSSGGWQGVIFALKPQPRDVIVNLTSL